MTGGIISWGYIKGSVPIRRTSFHPHEHEGSVQINLSGVKKKKKLVVSISKLCVSSRLTTPRDSILTITIFVF